MTREDKVVTMPPGYGYESKVDSTEEEQDAMESEEKELENVEVAKLDEWLSPDAKPPEKWIMIKSIGKKIKIRAVTEKERKDIRDKAPSKWDKKLKKAIKDENWIQMEMVRRCVLEPKITNRKILDHALAGDIAQIAIEISRISGFDVEDLMSVALG